MGYNVQLWYTLQVSDSYALKYLQSTRDQSPPSGDLPAGRQGLGGQLPFQIIIKGLCNFHHHKITNH